MTLKCDVIHFGILIISAFLNTVCWGQATHLNIWSWFKTPKNRRTRYVVCPRTKKAKHFFATAEGERSERSIEKQIYLMRGKKNRQMWKEWESRDVRWRERGGQVQEKVGGEYIELVEKWENGQKGVWAESNLKENCSDGWKCMQREEAGQGDRMMSWAEQLLDCFQVYFSCSHSKCESKKVEGRILTGALNAKHTLSISTCLQYVLSSFKIFIGNVPTLLPLNPPPPSLFTLLCFLLSREVLSICYRMDICICCSCLSVNPAVWLCKHAVTTSLQSHLVNECIYRDTNSLIIRYS